MNELQIESTELTWEERDLGSTHAEGVMMVQESFTPLGYGR